MYSKIKELSLFMIGVFNMKKGTAKKVIVLLVLMLLITIIPIPVASANSAQPPNLTVIVSFPPDDLTLTIRLPNGNTIDEVVKIEKKGWETYYRFYDLIELEQTLEGAILIVDSSETSFECPLPGYSFSYYDNLFTLNISNQSIEEGKSPVRNFILISMRIILTLLIEGLIFLAFGYRNKRSWIVFLIINLLTQGVLNVLLNAPYLGYWIIGFIFYEFIIFIIEMIAFPLILKEYKRKRAVIYAFVANLASLILGGVILTYLPV